VWLRIDGYEFPGRNVSDHDKDFDNWLIMHGRVELPPHEWEFRHPCLLLGELGSLIRWLESLPAEQPADIDFIEPLLAFGWDTADGNAGELALTLRGEAVPQYALSSDERCGGGIVLRWRPTPHALAAFSAGLNSQITQLRNGERQS
jgi:hypothetical protein